MTPGPYLQTLTFELGDKFELDAAMRYDEDKRENTTVTPESFLPVGTPPGSSGAGPYAHLERAAAEADVALLTDGQRRRSTAA